MVKKEFRHVVRVLHTDLIGNKPISYALRKVHGISVSLANAICSVSKIDKNKKVGDLSDKEIKEIESVVKDLKKYNIPSWLYNRRKDLVSGEDKHIVTSDLKFEKESDIKRLKKIKSYRGVRHAMGLPVRGQRTKAHFRHGKSVSVHKKAAKMTAKKEEEKK